LQENDDFLHADGEFLREISGFPQADDEFRRANDVRLTANMGSIGVLFAN
jgi:hypothetical protein